MKEQISPVFIVKVRGTLGLTHDELKPISMHSRMSNPLGGANDGRTRMHQIRCGFPTSGSVAGAVGFFFTTPFEKVGVDDSTMARLEDGAAEIFRSAVMSFSFLAFDFPDIQCSAKEAARGLAKPWDVFTWRWYQQRWPGSAVTNDLADWDRFVTTHVCQSHNSRCQTPNVQADDQELHLLSSRTSDHPKESQSNRRGTLDFALLQRNVHREQINEVCHLQGRTTTQRVDSPSMLPAAKFIPDEHVSSPTHSDCWTGHICTGHHVATEHWSWTFVFAHTRISNLMLSKGVYVETSNLV